MATCVSGKWFSHDLTPPVCGSIWSVCKWTPRTCQITTSVSFVGQGEWEYSVGQSLGSQLGCAGGVFLGHFTILLQLWVTQL